MLLADQVLVHAQLAGALDVAKLARQEMLCGRKDIGVPAVYNEALAEGLLRGLDQRRVGRDSVRREAAADSSLKGLTAV